MSYEEELYRRLTTGQGGSESRYLDRMSADTPAERDFLKKVMTGERGIDTPAERDFFINAMATGTPQAPQTPAPTAGGLGMSPEGMGGMTPAELDAYYKSFADQNINLNPMGGLIGAAHNEHISLWNEGEFASLGIKNMAETGSKNPLNIDISSAIINKKCVHLLIMKENN